MAAESVIPIESFIDPKNAYRNVKEIVKGINGSIPDKKRDLVSGVLVDILQIVVKKINILFDVDSSGDVISRSKESVTDTVIESTSSDLVKELYDGDYYNDVSGGAAIKRFFDELGDIVQSHDYSEFVKILSCYEPSKKRSFSRIKTLLKIKEEEVKEEEVKEVKEVKEEDDGAVEFDVCNIM